MPAIRAYPAPGHSSSESVPCYRSALTLLPNKWCNVIEKMEEYRRTSPSDSEFSVNVFFRNAWDNKVTPTKSITDFDIVRTIGTGSYGRVVLAKERNSDTFCAIKVLEKEAIVRSRQVSHISNERKLLDTIRFPFIIHMDYYFKDNVYLYFVMPFIPGGEMYSLLRRVGKFQETQGRFYASQIVLAFEYLHSFNIVYRDLKPENVLIDGNGYLKLTDLGFSKVLEGKTYTICGTPEYLAPEVVGGKGYGLAVDWWALGVLIYEMSVGFPPFYSMDKAILYQQITSGSVRMMPNFSEALEDILSNLLKTDPLLRYGNMKNGVDDIKRHRWFDGLNWADILNQREQAPFIPQLTSPGDTRYYDSFTEESLKFSSINLFSEQFKDF